MQYATGQISNCKHNQQPGYPGQYPGGYPGAYPGYGDPISQIGNLIGQIGAIFR